jgi:hypothetical protein
MSNINSLFSSDKTKTAEDLIDERMNNRMETMFKPKTEEDLRADIAHNEVQLRKSHREEKFKQNRLLKSKFPQHQVTNNSLKDKLSIPRELYEQCNNMKVTVSSK